MQRHVRQLFSAIAIGAALLVALAPSMAAGQPAKRAITLDDLHAIKTVGDPAAVARRQVGRLHGRRRTDAEKDKREHRHLDGQLGRRAARSSSPSRPMARARPAGARTASTCRSCAAAATEDEKKKGAQVWLLDRHGRRGAEAHRHRRRRRRLLLVARQHAPRLHEERQGPRRRSREEGRLEAQDRAAHRHRPVPLQAGPRRLPEAALHATSGSSTWRRRRPSRSPRRVRRLVAGVVAGRDEDRVRQQA